MVISVDAAIERWEIPILALGRSYKSIQIKRKRGRLWAGHGLIQIERLHQPSELHQHSCEAHSCGTPALMTVREVTDEGQPAVFMICGYHAEGFLHSPNSLSWKCCPTIESSTAYLYQTQDVLNAQCVCWKNSGRVAEQRRSDGGATLQRSTPLVSGGGGQLRSGVKYLRYDMYSVFSIDTVIPSSQSIQ